MLFDETHQLTNLAPLVVLKRDALLRIDLAIANRLATNLNGAGV
jgi:hypothetical protein